MNEKPNHPNIEEQLKKFRESIDAVDEKILKALNERAQIAQEVGNLKNCHQADYYIPSREKEVLNRLLEMNPGPLSPDAVTEIFREIISACRSLETVISVAYLGPEGTYHHSAAQAHFGRSVHFYPLDTINSIYDEVERQRVDYGVVAIENSIEGSVTESLDRLTHSKVNVVGERYYPISHNLISQSELHNITAVYSHPQAIRQCRKWLESNLPKAQLIDAPSTTQAVLNCKKDPQAAAIASALAAEIYDAPIQVRGIEDVTGNTTRFFIVGKKLNPPSGDDKTSMVVFIRDKVGALYSMLEPFKRNAINLNNIVSRPTKQEAWQYMFFIECQGHRNDEVVKKTIEEIESNSLYVKVLGSYPRIPNPS